MLAVLLLLPLLLCGPLPFARIWRNERILGSRAGSTFARYSGRIIPCVSPIFPFLPPLLARALMDSIATHNSPRTWFLTSSLSPLSIRLIRLLLAHGDYVVACLPPVEIVDEGRSAEFKELINECRSSRKDREGWKDRIRPIRCDGRASWDSAAPP